MKKRGARRRMKKTKKRIILGSGKCVHWGMALGIDTRGQEG